MGKSNPSNIFNRDNPDYNAYFSVKKKSKLDVNASIADKKWVKKLLQTEK